MKTAGLVVFAIGLLITFYTGFTLITKEKVVDLGALEITREKENHLSWPPILGIAVTFVGGGMFLYGRRKTI